LITGYFSVDMYTSQINSLLTDSLIYGKSTSVSRAQSTLNGTTVSRSTIAMYKELLNYDSKKHIDKLLTQL
jgi:hypothetical protein